MENWYWFGEIDEGFCEQGLKQIHEKKDDNVNIYLSSRGGKSDLAMLLHDAIRSDRAWFTIIAGGVVASCGITLMCACAQERRIAYRNTRFMVHDLYVSFKGDLASVKFELQRYERMQEALNGIYRAEFDYDGLVADSDIGPDFWFDAETAKRVKLVTSFV